MMRLATPTDWPIIDGWRSAHHARMAARNGLPISPGVGLDAAVWVVDDVNGTPRAAISFFDAFDAPPVRRIYDLYWAPDFCGRRAAYVLAGTVIALARDLGLAVVGDSNISNQEYLAILRRLGFVVTVVDRDRDTVYFRRDRNEGFRGLKQFQGNRPDESKRGRARYAAAADADGPYYGAAGQQCAHQR